MPEEHLSSAQSFTGDAWPKGRAESVLTAGRVSRKGFRKLAGSVVLFLVYCGLFLAGAFVNCGEGHPHEFLPTDHWAYEDLESLWTEGRLETLNLAVKPWSRIEIATALAADLAKTEDARRDPRFERLLREFATELSWLNAESGHSEPAPVAEIKKPNPQFRGQVVGDYLIAGTPTWVCRR